MSLSRRLRRNGFRVNVDTSVPYKMTDEHVRAIREAIRERAARLGIPEQTAYAIGFSIIVREAMQQGVTPSVLRHNLETTMATVAEQIAGRKVTL